MAQTLAASYSDRMVIPETLGKMVQAGSLGRKSGRGFYLHAKGKSPQPNFELTSSRRLAGQIPDLQQRMVLLMVNEAARCLEEEVVREPADVDFAMIMGTGFAPFRGGPLRYADAVGAAALIDAMDRLVQCGAAHFAPCALLRTMAAGGKNFYHNQ